MNRIKQLFTISVSIAIVLIKCGHENKSINHISIMPNYSMMTLSKTLDTVKFRLDSLTTPEMNSINGFNSKADKFVSMYNDFTKSLLIYEMEQGNLIKKIKLSSYLTRKELVKVSVFTKNFDSIFVVSFLDLYLIDSSGRIKNHINLIRNPITYFSVLRNPSFAAVKDNYLYLNASPYLTSRSLKDIRKWKVIYKINLVNKTTSVHIPLPQLYMKEIYGTYYVRNYVCFNDDDKLILSFPADSNVYVYSDDLDQPELAYAFKSQYFNGSLNPLSYQPDITADTLTKHYLRNDSYGPIYYDPFTNKYLRIAEKKISYDDYKTKKWIKEKSIIISDKNYKVVGETIIDRKCDPYCILFTPQGIYVKCNDSSENVISFIRFKYTYNSGSNSLTTKK